MLNAALSADITLPHKCKAGVCGACKAQLTSGSCSQKVTAALTPKELENNYILTCQAQPTSNPTSIKFSS
ncbi:2Fe-2S iron-sulfur cluster-binding protein [Rubritalea tangerina]|uniref:2Fe-2S iron-sulfur cluster-binding protein n=1 Tax=Rubritalea tangerina TaxID=430798 RepID=A0ABW4Z9Y4_9BACT